MRKSEKRARGEARQAINRQASIDSGLEAQKRDRERREHRARRAKKAREDRLAESAKKVATAMNGMSESAKKSSKVFANAVLASNEG